MQQEQQHLSPNSMDSGGGKNWTYDSCSLARIDENESSITSQFSSPTAILVPLDDENDIPVMDDSDSPKEKNWNDLQGRTLVPNSPNHMDDSLKNDNGDDENKKDDKIDKCGNPLACVFVASLSKRITTKELTLSLRSHFEQWGEIISINVLKDRKGRPYGFIQYERICDANQAIIQGYGSRLNGRAIRYELARVNRTLHLVSFYSPLTEKAIFDRLSEFGPIEEIKLGHDHGIPSAYVQFCYRNDAIRANWSLKTPSSLGSWMVQWATNVTDSIENKGSQSSVFVGHLDTSISALDLKKRFRKYGSISKIFLSPQYPAAFGIVYYKTGEAARRAIHAENGQTWRGRCLQVMYSEVKQQKEHGPPLASYPSFYWPHLPHSPDMTFASHDYDTSQEHSPSTTGTFTIRQDQPVQQSHHQNGVFSEGATPEFSSQMTTTTKSVSTVPNRPEVPPLLEQQDEAKDGSDSSHGSEYPSNNTINDQQDSYPVAYNGIPLYYHTQWTGNPTSMNSGDYYPFGDYYYAWPSTENSYPYDTNSLYYQMYPHTSSYYVAFTPGLVVFMVPCMVSLNPTATIDTSSSLGTHHLPDQDSLESPPPP